MTLCQIFTLATQVSIRYISSALAHSHRLNGDVFEHFRTFFSEPFMIRLSLSLSREGGMCQNPIARRMFPFFRSGGIGMRKAKVKEEREKGGRARFCSHANGGMRSVRLSVRDPSF